MNHIVTVDAKRFQKYVENRVREANGGHLVTVSKEVREWMDKNLCNCCTKSPDPKYHKESCTVSKQGPNADLGGNIE